MMMILLVLLGGCGDPPAERDVVRVDVATIEDAPEVVSMRERYIQAVCRVYTQPTCVASQAATCRTQATFPHVQSCLDNLRGQAAECDGLDAAFVTHRAQVSACITRLDSATCSEAAPFCRADGKRIDVTGPCAAVSQIVQRCARKADTGI